MLQGGKLAEGLEMLMSLERLCRVGNDFPNLKEVVLTAARLCRETQDWAQLNTTLTLLSKRRGQHSKAVTAMVQEVTLSDAYLMLVLSTPKAVTVMRWYYLTRV